MSKPTVRISWLAVVLTVAVSAVGAPLVTTGVAQAKDANGSAWTTLPSLPTARAVLAAAGAPCPPGQHGTCVYTMGGYTGARVATLESYDPAANAWTSLPPMPTAREGLAAAAARCPAGQTGRCVYAIGGDTAANVSDIVATVESYNPATRTWSPAAPLRSARVTLAAATAPCPAGQTGRCIYAVGGRGPGGGLDTVESYNPATGAWSPVAPLPTARDSLAAAAAPCPAGQTGECVYALGGRGAAPWLNTVDSYNPATDAWTTLPSMPTGRQLLAATAAPCPPGERGTCVYALGGQSAAAYAVDTVEAYNPATNAWTSLASMSTPRIGPAAAHAACPPGKDGTCVYAIGGANMNGFAAALEAFNVPAAHPDHDPDHDHGHDHDDGDGRDHDHGHDHDDHDDRD